MVHRSSLWLAGGAAVLACALFVGARANASDHRDEPSLDDDPVTDIGDVYAFMRPAKSGGNYVSSDHLVMVMTVHPQASATSSFAPGVDYSLSTVTLVDTQSAAPLDEVRVTCRFYAESADAGADAGALAQQPFTCSANGFFASGVTNVVSGSANDPVRAFAGLRADPAFGNVSAVTAKVGAGQLPDGDAGQNDFAASNVLAIVVEVDVDKVIFGDAGRSPIGVSAVTERVLP